MKSSSDIDEFATACQEDDLEEVKKLVPVVGVNCTYPDEYNCSGLMLAVVYDCITVFYFLLAQPGIDVNIADMVEGETILHCAVTNNEEEMVRVLANRDDMNLDIKNSRDETAKDLAAAKGFNHLVAVIEEAENNKKSRKMVILPSNMEVAIDDGVIKQENEFKDLSSACNGERIIGHKVAEVLHLAYKYDMPKLKKICEKTLMDDITIENAIDTLILVDRYKCSTPFSYTVCYSPLRESETSVRDEVIKFFKWKAVDIVKTGDWKKAMLKYPDLITELVIAALAKK